MISSRILTLGAFLAFLRLRSFSFWSCDEQFVHFPLGPRLDFPFPCLYSFMLSYAFVSAGKVLFFAFMSTRVLKFLYGENHLIIRSSSLVPIYQTLPAFDTCDALPFYGHRISHNRKPWYYIDKAIPLYRSPIVFPCLTKLLPAHHRWLARGIRIPNDYFHCKPHIHIPIVPQSCEIYSTVSARPISFLLKLAEPNSPHIHIPLFPRMNTSPYLCLITPPTYSSVFSSAMFMYPSTDWSSPRYSTPELSLTVMGAPIMALRKAEGSLDSSAVMGAGVSISDELNVGF